VILYSDNSSDAGSDHLVTLYSDSYSDANSDGAVTLYSDCSSDLYSSDLYIVVESIGKLLTLYSE
jgi:hypothetical protein